MLPQKILIIDDEKMIRLTTGILLKKEGYQVFEATNGNDGLAMIKKEKPDLVLLDIMMPVMDGWEVLDKIQSTEEIASTPVIVFTAGDFIESEKKAKKKKVQGILRKPFRLHEMIEIFALSSKGETHA